MHPVLAFQLGQQTCHYRHHTIDGLKQLLNDVIVKDSYFYIQWLFPVKIRSYWHTHTQPFQNEDFIELKTFPQAQAQVLDSADLVCEILGLRREGDSYHYKDNGNDYWLNNIGHEEKKISRIAQSLYLCGYPEIATALRDISIKLLTERGFKGGDPKRTQKTLAYWAQLFEEGVMY